MRGSRSTIRRSVRRSTASSCRRARMSAIWSRRFRRPRRQSRRSAGDARRQDRGAYRDRRRGESRREDRAQARARSEERSAGKARYQMNEASGPTLVEIRNLTKYYRRGDQITRVLVDINLDVRLGDYFALMGPSGSGKTTLL